MRLEAELRQAQQMEAVGRLASSIAHDFNNLLTVILGNIRLIRTDDPGIRESLTDAEAATRRGVTLARQLLSLANPVSRSTKVGDLSELVRGLDGTIRSVLPGSIALRIETPRERLAAMVDEVRVEQILLNLSINARDAMPSGGLLEIVVEARDGASPSGDAVVTVRDSGIGMAPEVAARAFEPFFTTKPVGLGTGLGLATVRRLMTELGGQVHLESTPGRGTTVEVRFPLAEGRRPVAVTAGASTATGGGDGPRLLVVDDEPSVRRVLSRQLSAAGFRVTEAADAIGALAALRTPGLDFDVLLTDLVMPGMRGDDLARQVCRDFPKVKVLCMSGTPAATSATGGREPWSTSQVIAKPLDIDEVAARIGAVLEV